MRIATKIRREQIGLGFVFRFLFFRFLLLVALLIFQDLVVLGVISVCCHFMWKVEEGLEWRFWESNV